MIRGQPAIGRNQSRDHASVRRTPDREAVIRFCGQAPRGRVHSLSGIAAIAERGFRHLGSSSATHCIKQAQVPNSGVSRLITNPPSIFTFFQTMPEVRALLSAGITRPKRSYGPYPTPASHYHACDVRDCEPRPLRPPPIAALPCWRAVPNAPADQNGFLPRSTRPSGRTGLVLPCADLGDSNNLTLNATRMPLMPV
jgi:hypothetical protein